MTIDNSETNSDKDSSKSLDLGVSKAIGNLVSEALTRAAVKQSKESLPCNHKRLKTIDKIKIGSRLVMLQSCRFCGRIRTITITKNYDSHRIYDAVYIEWLPGKYET